MAYYTLEPWGYDIENWRAAMIVSMIANTVRDPKKRRKPFTPDDFIPKEQEERQPQGWEALKAKSMGIFRRLGGKVP